MKNPYILICKSLDEQKEIFIDRNTYKLVLSEKKFLDRKWFFLGLFLYPFFKKLQNEYVSMPPVFSIIVSLVLGLFAGAVIEFIRSKYIEKREFEPLAADSEDLGIYLERGEKLLKSQFTFYVLLIVVEIINGIYIYIRNSLFDFVFSFLFAMLLTGIYPQFNLLEKKKIFNVLNRKKLG